jgi:hypothetical protein
MTAKSVIKGVHVVPMGMSNAFLVEGDDGLTLIDAGFPHKEAVAFPALLRTILEGSANRSFPQQRCACVFSTRVRLRRVLFNRSGGSCFMRSSAGCTTNTSESELSVRAAHQEKSFGIWFREKCEETGVPGSAGGLQKAGQRASSKPRPLCWAGVAAVEDAQ